MCHNYKTELYHYGVKGMKWGVKRAKPNVYVSKGRSGSSSNSSTANTKQSLTPEQKAARRKKALKVGAAVAGTALAAYGTYKLAKYMQNKRNAAAMKTARDYINNNFLEKVEYHRSVARDGATSYRTMFENGSGMKMTVNSNRSKEVGKHNAKVVSTARQMYKDATNTRLDRGLSKVVGAGDAVGDAVKRTGAAVGNTAKRTGTAVGDAAKRTGAAVGNTAKRTGTAVSNAAKRTGTAVSNAAKRTGTAVGNTAKNAKNRVLDTVNPIYEYRPSGTITTTRNINGMDVTKTVNDYKRYKIKRR